MKPPAPSIVIFTAGLPKSLNLATWTGEWDSVATCFAQYTTIFRMQRKFWKR